MLLRQQIDGDRFCLMGLITFCLTVYSAEAMEEERRRKEERKLAKLNGDALDSDEDEHDDGMDSDDSFM